jgi:apolipoprotein N-acyltransferase
VQNEERRVLNSVLNIHGGIYEKRHLVPLGEYIPLRFLIEFFNRFVRIPMSDIASGGENQSLLTAAGLPVGMSICFEDAFARDVIKDLPEARLLINVSNDAWFEDSHEPHQHHAIARMRALETGRYMIRSTNTGITSIIGPRGEVTSQLPQFATGVLTGEVQPLTGATPFVQWGDWLIVGLCSLLLLVAALTGDKNVKLSTPKQTKNHL